MHGFLCFLYLEQTPIACQFPAYLICRSTDERRYIMQKEQKNYALHVLHADSYEVFTDAGNSTIYRPLKELHDL